MSIKIHHGPNGSYKTSGAIQDDAVPALKEGRLIITNVRGFTLERVLQAMPTLPDAVDIINLDLESLEDMERMRTWFQWAPRGAFIIFDETQLVFPKAWREKDLERFDFPGGPEAAAVADRPMSWLDGWTRHRHWNWDIVLTTPNIAYIRDDIRMTCEMAYKHSNLAVIGIAGRYKEAQHDAQINRPPMEGTVIEYKRIKPDTFKLYQSTATGKTQDTKAGKSLFKSPKLLALLVFIALLIVAVLSLGGIDFGPANASKAPAASAAPVPAASSALPVDSPDPLDIGALVGKPTAVPAVELNHPYAPRTFAVRAVITATVAGRSRQVGQLDVVDSDGLVLRQSIADLEQLGYQVRVRGACLVDIAHPMGYRAEAVCPGRAVSRDESGRRVE
ncbi:MULTISPECIES: zonular occludens toxin domain-containing protein, partial [unclassified Pseudomonas]|uniref:zonular occludens toxin domain-containing protein n=1 Tax=unclassified Pseudomonas TaxID=196821 RepID=UPI002448D23E